MKRLISLLLIIALCTVCLTACGKKNKTEEDSEGGLAKTLEENGGYTVVDEDLHDDEEAPAEETEASANVVTRPVEEAETEASGDDGNHIAVGGEVIPFATEAPQPNTAITSFYEVSNTGLGFKYNYPANWTNLPGRNTVCFVQPMGNGTVYPGRVAVTMKRLYHSCGIQELQDEMKSYLKNISTQYDTKSFKYNKEIDTETKFMGKDALSTTYLAYDGGQEIKGYVIGTHFERYVFVFHFLCAYGDYEAFWPNICKMRDSVQVVKEN